ncbi:SRPBCC family protein [Streptomyces sp. NPDC057877]|uniref:SRPBCC family protein n=1 Tax=Streptomyces sp. NPDC057877 TaxID=3346269 RepID=UPI003685E56E
MADSKLREQVQQNPGTAHLKEELQQYIEARLQVMLQGVGQRMGSGARRLGEAHLGGPHLSDMVKRKNLVPTAASHAKDTLLDKVKEVTGKRHTQATEGGVGKGHTIIEDVDVGVPVREAYNQWTQYQEFSRFAKGVVDVQQKDDASTEWQVKVAKSNRRWHATITEQVPDERIAWTSEGEKGTTKGVVTFHPLGENLTKVLLVLQYFPKGVFEKTGGLVRAQGRRARLDLKLYRTFVMMRGEATGGWRGEIRDGEVVRKPEEVEAEDKDYEEEEQEEEETGEEAEAEDEAGEEAKEEDEAGEEAQDEAEDEADWEDEEDEEDENGEQDDDEDDEEAPR